MSTGLRRRILILQVGLLGILGFCAGFLFWGSSFVGGMVHDQLAAQQIYFPAQGSAALSPARTTRPLSPSRTRPPAAAPTASLAITASPRFIASLTTRPQGSRNVRVGIEGNIRTSEAA